MKLNLDYKIFFHLVMIYPFLLAVITVLGKEPFFITAPYFTFILAVLVFVILFSKKLFLNKWEIIQLVLLTLLIGVTIYNFSTVRYSLPILFAVYLLALQLFLSKYSSSVQYTDFPYFKLYLFFYLGLSLFFILVPLTPAQRIFRFEGFLGSPTVYSAFLVLLYILAQSSFKKNRNKLLWYAIVFLFVFLSKTRLVLILMIVLPLLYLAIDKWKFSLKKIFVMVFLVLVFLYPAYAVVIEYFPNLVTIRYESGKDRSYNLRYYLYKITQEDFLKQETKEKLLGQGNEHSRLLVRKRLKADIYPHNDFIRILNDWGIIGFIIFALIIYRYSSRSKVALLVGIMYLIQFYSNLVFNMFLISILVAVATLSFRDEVTSKQIR
jgi:O-antigen ligase